MKQLKFVINEHTRSIVAGSKENIFINKIQNPPSSIISIKNNKITLTLFGNKNEDYTFRYFYE